jgi:hypothetical protein
MALSLFTYHGRDVLAVGSIAWGMALMAAHIRSAHEPEVSKTVMPVFFQVERRVPVDVLR